MKQFYGTIRLPRSLYLAPPEPKVAKKIPGRKGAVKYPDEVILQMRKMHEVERKSVIEVINSYPEINPQYVRNILDYTSRSKLILKV